MLFHKRRHKYTLKHFGNKYSKTQHEMKKFFWLISIIILAVLVIWQFVANSISAETKQRAHEYAVKAEAYCQQNGYRTDYCFLVDFDVHSGKNRFFVWDFEKQKIVYRIYNYI